MKMRYNINRKQGKVKLYQGTCIYITPSRWQAVAHQSAWSRCCSWTAGGYKISK